VAAAEAGGTRDRLGFFLPPMLVFVGVVVLAIGAEKGLGIALLVVGLLLMLVPISPILRARVRRREERARKE